MVAYKHLRITKENIINSRRKRSSGFKNPEVNDVKAHSEKLMNNLSQVIDVSEKQIKSDNNNIFFKIDYPNGNIKFLNKHGIDFLSQEGKETIAVCTDDNGLKIFKEHLSQLGLEDQSVIYRNTLYAIQKIDNWTSEDRKSWSIKNKGFPQEDIFLLDIELWPLFDSFKDPRRLKFVDNFKKWLSEKKIKFCDQLNVDSFVLLRISVTPNHLDDLLNHNDIRTIDLLPTTGITYEQLNVDINHIPSDIPAPTVNAAKICVLDSGIATNHPLLKSAIGDSYNFTQTQSAFDQCGHGTAVASVALYGDLEACNESGLWRPELFILNGKILDDNGDFDISLAENTIDKAVRYFVEEYECKIFNFSVGNENAPYSGSHIRGIAYILDKLARELDVLFVVSVGNFSDIFCHNTVQNFSDRYPEYLLEKETVIIDPAPAANVLTIGAISRHEATDNAQKRINDISGIPIAKSGQPSPFTRHGPSNQGMIKPDLIAIGGNVAVNRGNRATDRRLGVLTCKYNFTENTVFNEMSGTSFSAPYIAHLAGRLLNNYPNASANLLRALLVNHANVPQIIKEIFNKSNVDNNKDDKNKQSEVSYLDVVGYGLIDESELFKSTDNVVGLLAEEQIENDKSQFFELPIPDDFLKGKSRTREIRVTLAYYPAVRTTRRDYIASLITFKVVEGDSLETITNAFNNENKKNIDSIPEIKCNKTVNLQLRSKGTVQSSNFRIIRKKNNIENKYFVIVTRQDKDWGNKISKEYENYALVITLADRENENAQLYMQIKERLELKNSVRIKV